MHYGVSRAASRGERHGILDFAVLQDPHLVAAKIADEDTAVVLQGVVSVRRVLSLRVRRFLTLVSIGKRDKLVVPEYAAANVLRSVYSHPVNTTVSRRGQMNKFEWRKTAEEGQK